MSKMKPKNKDTSMTKAHMHKTASGEILTIPALSGDPSKAVQEFISRIDALSDIYVRENQALKNADTNCFLDLQDEKVKVARFYQFGMDEMLKRKGEIKTVNADLKEKLKATQAAFHELTERNKKALGRVNESINRLSDKIRRVAMETAQEQNTVRYSETGEIYGPKSNIVSTGVSETA